MTRNAPRRLPIPPEIQEEPIRPLLAVLDHAARATLVALHAENPDGWPDPDVDGELPPDAATWVQTLLAVQIEGVSSASVQNLRISPDRRRRAGGNRPFGAYRRVTSASRSGAPRPAAVLAGVDGVTRPH